MTRFNFDAIAQSYDEYYETPTGAEVDAVEKRLVKKFLKKVPVKEALEIGCGTGHWSSFFCDNGFQITGVDIGINMINQAVKKDIPGSVFMQMDAMNLAFPAESVKNIFSIATAEFVEDQEKFFDEAFRVLKRGGCLLTGVLNAQSTLGKTKGEHPIYSNAQFFTPKSLHHALSRFGRPTVKGCVMLTNDQQVADYNEGHNIPEQERDQYGAFLVGFVKKL